MVNARECAIEIWNKMEELMVVDNDGLDLRQENAINKIEIIVQRVINEAIDYYASNMDID